jgi:glycosyltransferase involved in cell wall biosynthesis
MDRPRIAYIHNVENTFVEIDRNALRQRFPLTDVHMGNGSLTLGKAIRAIRETDIGFGWFASWHTFLSTLVFSILRREFILVIGGYDLAKMPQIGYGHQRGGMRKWVSRATMKMATMLMTNSEFSKREAEENAELDPRGIEVVYHGIPCSEDALPPKPSAIKVLTVGNVDRMNLDRKGHEPFVRVAADLPEFEFVLVGAWKDDAVDKLRSIAPKNVSFLGRVDDDKLRACFEEAAVYVQASSHEGFGVSLAEAMLSGCVPVVSRTGALPEVVGSAGFYVDYPVSCSQLALAISKAAESRELAEVARERIQSRFPVSIREQGLWRLVDHAWSRSGGVNKVI